MNASPKILITGGAGFIGSHLTARLLAEGCQVTVVDDLSTGSAQNLAACRDNPRLRLVESTVSNFSGLKEAAQEATFIFHLAAAVGVELVVSSPIRTIRTNLTETEAVLEAADANHTPVLLASTSEVYGKSQKPSFSEEDDLLIGPPTLGRWSYACSKLMDEFLALAYARERGLPVVIARLFNTVGPRQTGRYGMVLPRFVESARAGSPIRVYGSGNQTRCFCYVGDTVEALVRLSRTPQARGEVFNIGGTEEVSILGLAQQVKETLGSNSPIELIPYDQAYSPGFEDMLRRRPAVEKLERVTGFRPATKLLDTIKLTAGIAG